MKTKESKTKKAGKAKTKNTNGKSKKSKDDNVAEIGHNSDDQVNEEEQKNFIQTKTDEVLEIRRQKAELGKAERGIKAEVKQNGITMASFNRGVSLAAKDPETRNNMLQDEAIVFEALGFQTDFAFDEPELPGQGEDPMDVAKAEGAN